MRNSASMDDRLLIPLAEACRRLSLSLGTVRNRLREPGVAERIGAVKIASRWKLQAEAVERIASEGLDFGRAVAPAQGRGAGGRVFQRVDFPHFRR